MKIKTKTGQNLIVIFEDTGYEIKPTETEVPDNVGQRILFLYPEQFESAEEVKT